LIKTKRLYIQMTKETELFDNICKANVQQSIYISTQIMLNNQDIGFGILQNVFISVCSHIGSFISLYDIRLWLDIVDSILVFIEEDKVIIKDIYILITKLCILCDTYIKNPITKTGTLSIKMVREKVIDMFTIEDFALSESGISNFEGVFPPTDSPSYNLAIQIVTGYAYLTKQLNDKSVNSDANFIFDLSNKVRHSIDYIVRKKYTFETKFYKSDNDAVWFLWGVISLLFNDKEMDRIYQLFNFEYKKSYKSKRIGLLWGAGITMIYLKKKDIARTWNKNEKDVLSQIEKISMTLYKDIRKSLKEDIEQQNESEHHYQSGIEYIRHYRPIEHDNAVDWGNQLTQNNENDSYIKTIKSIRYK